MRVSATEELASPHEGTGGAGPSSAAAIGRRVPAMSAVGEEKYQLVGSAHASSGASWQRRVTSGAPRVMSPEALARH